jgi:transcriptional regulator of nitric oxide reductase
MKSFLYRMLVIFKKQHRLGTAVTFVFAAVAGYGGYPLSIVIGLVAMGTIIEFYFLDSGNH